jgi:hypothetical protein
MGQTFWIFWRYFMEFIKPLKKMKNTIKVLVKYKIKKIPINSKSKELKFKDGKSREKQEVLDIQRHTNEAIISELQRRYPKQEVKLLSVDWVNEIPEWRGKQWYEILIAKK